jgi:xanthine/uracil permease
LPLCKIDLIHTITNTETGLLITHKIVMTGLMTFLFAKVIGSKISASLPESVENLIKLAETNE